MKNFLLLPLLFVLAIPSIHHKKIAAVSAINQSESLQSVEPASQPAAGQPPMLELDGTVDSSTVDPIIAKLKELDASGVPEIWLKLNTPGGSVNDGENLISAIEGLHAKTTCVVAWTSMSMGMPILESCTKRLAVPNALFMIHLPAIKSGGNEHELQESIEILQSLRKIMVNQLLKKMKITKAALNHHLDTHNWYFEVDEALKVGAIDGIIEIKDLPPVTPITNNSMQSLLQLLTH